MPVDHAALLGLIRRAFPASALEPLPEDQLADIRRRFPGIPEEYLELLRHVGAGRIGSMGLALYDGPCGPEEFFDEETAADLAGTLFFADDFGGWHAGFDTRDGWRVVGVSSVAPRPLPEREAGVGAFLTRWVEDRRPNRGGNRPE
ncbi:hypothetical protein OJF2_34340 [Aquisphaera giovannonii]|uniref:Knr4/Smi1-like domain-containing protein n=1 Tax=Aquisphaera giovannonii TaxID=406548 RepID=A0A5B9W3X8_9BACT|nr:SMI1/KNR4 family protein [Aquisphaera giovannonii]QEH34889.1 hypothetical protein OJF2_34340 [Aquisphaera giovannonii]